MDLENQKFHDNLQDYHINSELAHWIKLGGRLDILKLASNNIMDVVAVDEDNKPYEFITNFKRRQNDHVVFGQIDKNGKLWGFCKKVDTSMGWVTEGYWHNDMYQGYSRMTHSDGS